ncbi:MAG: glycosyltransferase [Actinomycetota bacterium]
MSLSPDASVLVVLVASEGAAGWLPDVLRGIADQHHRPIDVIALDNATTDGCGEILLGHLGERRVVRVDQKLSYAKAVGTVITAAGERGLGGEAILLLHDDCVMDPDVVTELVAALGLDSVGIAAPRLVDYDDETVLQDIGQTTDRFGRAVPRVERGELDAGQHSGVRAVMYATSAALLVETALVERIGLFDERFEGFREDLDLCWRARICGALTVVCSDVRAKHVAATVRGRRPTKAKGRFREFSERHLIASLLKNYARPRAMSAVPATLLISMANAVLFLASGRRRLAVQVVRAVAWNITHLRTTLKERRRVQAIRTEDDAVVSVLQHHGSRRLRSQFERLAERLFGDVQSIEEFDIDAPPPTLFERIRARPLAAATTVALILGFLAARDLFASGALSGADHGRFPEDPGGFFTAFASGWRGPSGAAPTTPGMLLLGVLSTLSFGSTWLAHRLLLLSLVPLAAAGAAMAARRCGLGKRAQLAAAFAYGLSPPVLGGFADGRLIEGIILATMPWALSALLRHDVSRGRVGLGGVTIGVAVAVSLAPWLIIGLVVMGMTLAMMRRDIAPLRIVGLFSVVAVIANFPWSFEFFRSGSPLFAGGSSGPVVFAELWTGLPGGILPTFLAFGLPVAAILGLAAAREDQRRMAAELAAIAVVALVWAGLVGRVPVLAPRPSLPLAVGAICGMLLVGIAAERIGPLLRGRTFGTVHIAVFIMGALLIGQSGATLGFIMAGPQRDLEIGRGLVPEFFAIEAERGAFRILWLDGDSANPTFALTGPTGTTMTDSYDRPAGPGYDAAERAVEILAGQAGTAAGRILATAGVRYVVVRPTASTDLAIAVGDQIELSFEQEIGGALIFSNALDLYTATSMRSPAWASVSTKDLDAAQGVESNPFPGSPLAAEAPGVYEGTAAKESRALLLGEPFHPGWRAFLGGTELRPRRSFGWATGFDLEQPLADSLPLRFVWRGQFVHRVAVLVWIVLLLLIAAAWGRGPTTEELA